MRLLRKMIFAYTRFVAIMMALRFSAVSTTIPKQVRDEKNPGGGEFHIEVRMDQDTVWLTQTQNTLEKFHNSFYFLSKKCRFISRDKGGNHEKTDFIGNGLVLCGSRRC